MDDFDLKELTRHIPVRYHANLMQELEQIKQMDNNSLTAYRQNATERAINGTPLQGHVGGAISVAVSAEMAKRGMVDIQTAGKSDSMDLGHAMQHLNDDQLASLAEAEIANLEREHAETTSPDWKDRLAGMITSHRKAQALYKAQQHNPALSIDDFFASLNQESSNEPAAE
jgi:hypothetical protein